MKLIKSENFGTITCDIYDDNGNRYMTREQIGRALKYSDPRTAIAKIHARYKDRLDKHSRVYQIGTPSGTQECVVYTRKGVMEICRHSDQPNADAFMDWTWQVMDAVIEQKQSATPNELIAALANANVITDRRLAEHEKKLAEVSNRMDDIQQHFAAPMDDWRSQTSRIVKAIAEARGGGAEYPVVRGETYRALEFRAHCNLKTRLAHAKEDALSAGNAERARTLNKLDVIQEDDRLREVYTLIIKEMYAQYAGKMLDDIPLPTAQATNATEENR